MCAENQAAPKETFDFQAMGGRYNAPRSGGKSAYAGLNSANAESLYHVHSPHMVWMAIRPFSATSMCILYPNPTHFTINTLRQSAQALPPKRTSSPWHPFRFYQPMQMPLPNTISCYSLSNKGCWMENIIKGHDENYLRFSPCPFMCSNSSFPIRFPGSPLSQLARYTPASKGVALA